MFSVKITLLSLTAVLLLPKIVWANGLVLLPLYCFIYPLSILLTALTKTMLFPQRVLGRDLKIPARIACGLFIVFLETIFMYISYHFGLKIALFDFFDPYYQLTLVWSSSIIFLMMAWPLNVIMVRNVAHTRYLKALLFAAIFPTFFFTLSLIVYKDDFPAEKGLWWGVELQKKRIRKSPESHLDFYLRGLENLSAERNEEAIADFTQAIKLKSWDAGSYFGRGEAYLKERQWDLAIADFTKELELSPYYISAYIYRAEAYYQKGQYDAAIADLDFFLQLKPKDGSALYIRGEAYKQKGDFNQSISDFTEVLTGTGTLKRVESLHARAEAYFLKKDYKEAWEDVREAERLGHPVSTELLLKLRQIEMQTP